ncbi:hypothetical protein ACJIZ3_014451 [Penstemon smallii]|uniref:Uncharacterized protein n=1 Tax=Penstemon smallii TaxID=265156 RepID=A0ABD3RJQ2_9LAMI
MYNKCLVTYGEMPSVSQNYELRYESFNIYHLRRPLTYRRYSFTQALTRTTTQIQSRHDDSAYQAPYGPAENMHPTNTNVYTNGVSSCMQVVVNMGDHAGRIPLLENIPLAQSSNAGMMQGMNEGIINSGGAYPDDSLFTFGADNNLLEPHNSIYNAGNPSLQMLDENILLEPRNSIYNGSNPNLPMLDENMLEPEMNSFGILGQLPQNLIFICKFVL